MIKHRQVSDPILIEMIIIRTEMVNLDKNNIEDNKKVRQGSVKSKGKVAALPGQEGTVTTCV